MATAATLEEGKTAASGDNDEGDVDSALCMEHGGAAWRLPLVAAPSQKYLPQSASHILERIRDPERTLRPLDRCRMQFYREDFREVLALLEQEANRSDPYAVRRACAEFKRLVLHSNAVRHAMVEDGRLLPSLVGIVAGHVQEQQGDVLADCCRFFQRLIAHKQPTELDIQSKITEAGCLALMSRGLAAHAEASRLYIEICRLVALMSFDTMAAPHADNQTDIASAGLYELICTRLEQPNISEAVVAAGCEAIAALIYENDTNSATGLHRLGVLSKFSQLLKRFPESLRIAHFVLQTFFQLMTMESSLSDDVVDTGMLPQIVELLDSSALMQEYRGPTSFLVHWDMLKFLEIVVRHNDFAKDEFCRCNGPAVVVHALIRRIQEPRHADNTEPWALQYASCMLLCRVATEDGDSPAVSSSRAKQLVQSSAHQVALDILRSVGIAKLGDGDRASRFWAAVEQAVRLLELIAALEVNRVPLTRLGASRQVKLIYNNPEVAAQPGLQLLCEHAVANIEGT